MPIVQLTPTNSAVLPAATKSWRSSSGADLGGTDAEAIGEVGRGMGTAVAPGYGHTSSLSS